MNILLCGANGFLGRHIGAALEAAGHRVVRGVRRPRTEAEIAIDFQTDIAPDIWLPRLQNIDAVVNAIGILHESDGQTFDAIHRDAPIALFRACESAGVQRVIQVSALGGESGKLTPYMCSKREADAYLLQSKLDYCIVRPSLVVGPDGESSRFFRMLASLPVIGLPGRGQQRLQPVHVDDISEAVVRLLATSCAENRVINLVGPHEMTYREMLLHYRNAMDLASPIFMPIPMSLMQMSAVVAAKLPQRVLSPDTLRMLQENNVADPAPMTALLGRKPKPASEWFIGATSDSLRAPALNAWGLPMLRWSLALVWIVTGLVSLGIYPVDQSIQMLNRVGLYGSLASLALYGAAALDFVFGILTICLPRRWLWRMQFLLVAGYTVIISIFLPEYWLHPFGPILKNIPILAILIALDASTTRKK